MERVGEHHVPSGPLAVRWLAYEVADQRAGVSTRARVRLQNAGTAPWRSRGREGVQLAYHWLDPLGNAIVWDGNRIAFPEVVQPGDEVELETTILAPRPPGSYRLAFDLVEEFRFWFEELGSTPLGIAVAVRPRIDERRLTVNVYGPVDAELEAALAAQEEPLVEGEAAAVAHLVSGARPRSRLVARRARRARGRVCGSRARDRRRVAQRPPRSRSLGSRWWSQPALLGATPDAVAPRRAATATARGAARLRRARPPLRGPRRDQTSVAIRSSERLNTRAPTTSATAAATIV